MLASIAAGACSDTIQTDGPVPTTTPCSATASPTIPAKPSTKVVPITGTGDQTVGLPGDIPLPLLVHARHDGADAFVVNGVDASGKATQVFATALGPYDATFAVGFVDACAAPTSALHIATKSKWRLDIANAGLAPRYDNAKGVAGKGDAVLSYVGAGTKVRITYSGTARFDVTTYGNKGPELLAHSVGAFQNTVTLPHGPVFVAITAQGAWTIGAA